MVHRLEQWMLRWLRPWNMVQICIVLLSFLTVGITGAFAFTRQLHLTPGWVSILGLIAYCFWRLAQRCRDLQWASQNLRFRAMVYSMQALSPGRTEHSSHTALKEIVLKEIQDRASSERRFATGLFHFSRVGFLAVVSLLCTALAELFLRSPLVMRPSSGWSLLTSAAYPTLVCLSANYALFMMRDIILGVWHFATSIKQDHIG